MVNHCRCPSYSDVVIVRMAGNLVVCSVDPLLKEQLKKFRFNKDKSNNAIVMKVGIAILVSYRYPLLPEMI